jgi:hypothetical protein
MIFLLGRPPPPPLPLPLPLLAFGNIWKHLETFYKHFPEFLLLVLPYIADMIVWNSIVSSNRKIYKRSKEDEEMYLPPWPMNFKLLLNYAILCRVVPGWNSDSMLYRPVL